MHACLHVDVHVHTNMCACTHVFRICTTYCVHVLYITYLQSADGSGTFYYCYNLLDNYITSELFKVTNFKTEKASIRIMSTREKLGVLFVSQEDMKVHPCTLYMYVYVHVCVARSIRRVLLLCILYT